MLETFSMVIVSQWSLNCPKWHFPSSQAGFPGSLAHNPEHGHGQNSALNPSPNGLGGCSPSGHFLQLLGFLEYLHNFWSSLQSFWGCSINDQNRCYFKHVGVPNDILVSHVQTPTFYSARLLQSNSWRTVINYPELWEKGSAFYSTRLP